MQGPQVFLGRRTGGRGWQFPQGGMRTGEEPEEAVFRELEEEIGVGRSSVELVGRTRGWLRYRLPPRYVRRHQQPLCIGQKQRWFLLRLTVPEARFDFGRTPEPEFDHWRWAPFWEPVREVIYFKRPVYAQRADRARAARLCRAAGAGAAAVVGHADRERPAPRGARAGGVASAADVAPAQAAVPRRQRSAAGGARAPSGAAQRAAGRRQRDWAVRALRVLRARPLRRRLRSPRGRAAAHRARGAASSTWRRTTASCVPGRPSSTPSAQEAHASRRRWRARSEICRRRSRDNPRSSLSTAAWSRRAPPTSG